MSKLVRISRAVQSSMLFNGRPLHFSFCLTKLVRVQSADGTKRIEVNSNEQVASLYQKTLNEFKIDASRRDEWALFLDRNREKPIKAGSGLVGQLVKHGDIIYLFQSQFGVSSEQSMAPTVDPNVEEDEIDQILARQDGKIVRGRDEQL